MNLLILTLYCVLCLSTQVLAEDENEVKRGQYPFMAFLYYLDEGVLEVDTSRFIRGAVLIKPDWLISTSVGPARINDIPYGFPRKTLIARLGAVSIDTKFTFNEDEDEQEREIIQVVHPYNHSTAQWWKTDIILLKTLLPFNMTSAVSPGVPRMTHNSNNSNCFILVFAKKTNLSEERTLIQLYVEVLSPSEECGVHFANETMLCANEIEESNKHTSYDTQFCKGNSGGPLVCENEVLGIQTYIENNCVAPHLYQDFAAWHKFINCGTEEKCNSSLCKDTCKITNKDQTLTDKDADNEIKEAKTTENQSVDAHSADIDEPPSKVKAMSYTDETESTPTLTTTTTERYMSEETTPLSRTYEPPKNDNEEMSWPKEKVSQKSNALEEEEISAERKTNVEAQRMKLKSGKKNSAVKVMCFFKSVFSVFILTRLV